MRALMAENRNATTGVSENVQTPWLATPNRRRWIPYAAAGGLLLAAVILSLTVGSVTIPPSVILHLLLGQNAAAGDSTSASAVIFYQLRLPRTALVCLTGAALAGSGAAYQGLFRNPLADPFLIGVASGAGLGAVLAMLVHWPYTTLGLLAIPAAAMLTGLATVGIVYLLARSGQNLQTGSLILAGVAVSSFATSLTS
ncbi:MAG TPA: iron chelate uptake ABC transporter family permease subunit, partial [Candidatus Methylomirabilis sp.]|nr:iron chelate uptake ABC transporter family permease subunit [Candidatus Methylomirabilis sp.]